MSKGKIRVLLAKPGVHTLTPEQLAACKKAAEPALAALVKEIGGEAPRLWKLIQDGKKQCPI